MRHIHPLSTLPPAYKFFPRYLLQSTLHLPPSDIANACQSDMEDAQTFRFFDLPPEIRNMVYKLVFESYSAHVSLVHADVKRPAVLSANRQL